MEVSAIVPFGTYDDCDSYHQAEGLPDLQLPIKHWNIQVRNCRKQLSSLMVSNEGDARRVASLLGLGIEATRELSEHTDTPPWPEVDRSALLSIML